MQRSSPRPSPVVRRLLAAVRRADVRLVRFLYTDNGGITRGKATHVAGLAERVSAEEAARIIALAAGKPG